MRLTRGQKKLTEHASRELDPHLHTHVVVMNITNREQDAPLASVESRTLYAEQHTAGQLSNRQAVPRQVVEAIARRDQIRVLVDGMTAANDLGLTNAIPAKIVVHTDSRLKSVHLGNLEISFRPTAASKLFWAGRPAMRIVQALHWLRDTTADAEEDRSIRHQLQQLLWREPDGARLRKDLHDGMSALPAWMQDYLRTILTAEPKAA